jgi:hypothetical protein
MSRYKVIDSQGYTLRVFNSYIQAMTYKIAMGRMDWTLKEISHCCH